MKKVEIFLEEEEIKSIADILKELKKKGFNTSRSEWIRSAVVAKLESEVKK